MLSMARAATKSSFTALSAKENEADQTIIECTDDGCLDEAAIKIFAC
jgi:hypothetical protein